MTSSQLTCSPRWATPRSPERNTFGAAATRIAERLGTPLMPWQQHVLDIALEIDPDTGKLVYREVILTVPRQSGKTTLLLVLILLRALAAPRQNIKYTAQTAKDARDKWMDDWLPILNASPFARHYRTRQTNGHEALKFHNGSIQSIIATTQKSGHGGSLDLGILDEAFAHTDARLEQAIKPAMITRPQPQLWVVSTAGTPDLSPYLWDKVEKGRLLADAGMRSGAAYFEWAAADDADPADPATWRSCMPALGITTPEDAIAADFASMELSEFERAYLNRWKTSVRSPVIPLADWLALTDHGSQIVGPVSLAFDVTPDHSSASVCVAGRRQDGRHHVEVAHAARGTSWVPDYIKKASADVSSIVCDARGPAGSLLPRLSELGIDPICVKPQEHAQACGMFFDAVQDGALRHLGTPDMTEAIDGAVKRPLVDAWVWSRRSSAIDISPLVACTLALWASETQKTEAPSVWDLDEIVARLREQDAAAPV